MKRPQQWLVARHLSGGSFWRRFTQILQGPLNTRLRDLNVPDYLVDEVLIGVLAQELVVNQQGHKRNLRAEYWAPQKD